jgi:hypothetical protein
MLWLEVRGGFQGDVAKKYSKDYWRRNLATWKDAPLPALTAMDVDLELDPAGGRFRIRGHYDLVNQREMEIAQIPFTCGNQWENLKWTLDGVDYVADNRAGLHVFTPPKPLAPKSKLRIGFAYEASFPRGISKNGGSASEFILPASVVLTSFSPGFMPVMGYLEEMGIDDDNRYDKREYSDHFYEGITDPLFGSATPFTTRARITAPADYTINSIGVLKSDTTADGKRTVVWESDQRVRLFNVVAGRWAERRGQGTAIYHHPGHTYNIEEMSEALEAARKYYSEWFYPYPWRELKLSEFPDLASYAQGFATDITFSEGIGFLTKSEPRTNLAFLVTAHEAAHQWWGNLLTPGKGPGGNILSEGMAHFSTILLLEQVKGLQARIEFCKRIEEGYGEGRRKDSERPLVKTDGSRPGDTTVTYDKGGWVFWMLLQNMGRDKALAGLQAFIRKYQGNPDHAVLQDFIETMRPFAADKDTFDGFVKQWFVEVVVPEYRLSEARRERATLDHSLRSTTEAEVVPSAWNVIVRVRNAGTGRMPIEVAAAAGERFSEDGEITGEYHDARMSVTLGPGEEREITIRCDFKPDRVLVDPDARVFQLLRKMAIVRF